jgi:hypothetical protein
MNAIAYAEKKLSSAGVIAAKKPQAIQKNCLHNHQTKMAPENPTLEMAGLCSQCQHARLVGSSKGSAFLLCELSKTDPRFARYPRLPVLVCSGYEPRTQEK